MDSKGKERKGKERNGTDMKHSRIALWLALAALLLCSTLAAQTPEVKCGMKVTSNLTLTGNLACPNLAADGAALTVTAPGVTVDLNGYAISGSGTGAGILVPGTDSVTIMNGEVRGFNFGISVATAGTDVAYSTKIARIRATRNTTIGIGLDAARFAEIRQCEAVDNGLGGILVWTGTSYSVVADNLVYGNGNSGIYVGCEPWSLDPKTGAISACDGKHANDNVIERNAVVANGWMKTAPAARVGIGLLFANRNQVQDNLVIDNNTYEAPLNMTYGIGVFAGADNVVAGNHVSNNGRGIIVSSYAFSTPTIFATNTVVSGNTAIHNAGGGIYLSGDGSSGTVIRDNSVIANGNLAASTGFPVQCKDGIRVTTPSGTSLINNRAYDNAGYGVNVEAKDVSAQFGNIAMRNGEAKQCAGVACK
jgi:parallel beta-helix repeat protein